VSVATTTGPEPPKDGGPAEPPAIFIRTRGIFVDAGAADAGPLCGPSEAPPFGGSNASTSAAEALAPRSVERAVGAAATCPAPTSRPAAFAKVKPFRGGGSGAPDDIPLACETLAGDRATLAARY
jgi:hypothetical protein